MAQLIKNKSAKDEYDGDHNTVSPYDDMEKNEHWKWVDVKADRVPKWTDKNAGS